LFLGLGLGLGFRFEFGIGKLIGGAVGTVGWGSRKTPVSKYPSLGTDNKKFLLKIKDTD